MSLLLALLSPAVVGMVSIFLAILWMLKDEKDKSRPLLVMALVINLFYGFLLTIVMGREDSFLPWKYDPVLLRVDGSLGISSASIALPLQGAWRIPLAVIYELLLPMMIFWFLIIRETRLRKSLIIAYVAELVVGPMLYAIMPACGPIYAFGAKWLHPPSVGLQAIRLGGMPNAFPSLHVGTAFVFVLFAQGKLWRGISLVFLFGTALATLATGEHYVVDLIPGLAFGCFAASVGFGKFRRALIYLAVVLFWSLATRFESGILVGVPFLVRSMALFTLVLVSWVLFESWRVLDSRIVCAMVAPVE